jgi:hypothetical protein
MIQLKPNCAKDMLMGVADQGVVVTFTPQCELTDPNDG